jgi:hypothetical protein
MMPLPALLVWPWKPCSSMTARLSVTGMRAMMFSPMPLVRAISGVP